MRDPEGGGKQERELADQYRASQHLLRQLGPGPRSCYGTWPRCTTETPARRRPGPNDSARGSGSRALGSARPSAARHSETDSDGRRAVGHARLARSPVAVSRPRPSPAGVPARGAAQSTSSTWRCISGRRQVDGGLLCLVCVQASWPSARIRLGGPCPGVLTGSEPRIQGFCLRVWRFSGPCGGLYVAVRGIGDAGARTHVHIADSTPGASAT
jgi:hypothetical protein